MAQHLGIEGETGVDFEHLDHPSSQLMGHTSWANRMNHARQLRPAFVTGRHPNTNPS